MIWNLIKSILFSRLNPFNRLDVLLRIEEGERDFLKICVWWELRRWLYNFICFCYGMFCLFMLEIIAPPQSMLGSRDIIEPVLLAAFAILCQICYTLGWITEHVFRAFAEEFRWLRWLNPGRTYARRCFKLGLGLTLFAISFPVIDWSIANVLIWLNILTLEEVIMIWQGG